MSLDCVVEDCGTIGGPVLYDAGVDCPMAGCVSVVCVEADCADENCDEVYCVTMLASPPVGMIELLFPEMLLAVTVVYIAPQVVGYAVIVTSSPRALDGSDRMATPKAMPLASMPIAHVQDAAA